MKFHWGSKDGGPESKVYMYGYENKNGYSLLLLRFEDGSRDAFHSHAFGAISWLMKGHLQEYYFTDPQKIVAYFPSFHPIMTPFHLIHKVVSFGRSWVLSLRGPWKRTWLEFNPKTGVVTKLAWQRKEVHDADNLAVSPLNPTTV